MLVGQPVVFGVLELEVGVAELALLRPEVLEVLGAVVGVAQLILVVDPRAVLAAVGWPGGGRRVNVRAAGQAASVSFRKPRTVRLRRPRGSYESRLRLCESVERCF